MRALRIVPTQIVQEWHFLDILLTSEMDTRTQIFQISDFAMLELKRFTSYFLNPSGKQHDQCSLRPSKWSRLGSDRRQVQSKVCETYVWNSLHCNAHAAELPIGDKIMLPPLSSWSTIHSLRQRQNPNTSIERFPWYSSSVTSPDLQTNQSKQPNLLLVMQLWFLHK